MARDQVTIGGCPKCDSSQLTCKYNQFECDDLRIDSWEHKCPDCGYRETTAYRSDEPASTAGEADPTVCPYCHRSASP